MDVVIITAIFSFLAASFSALAVILQIHNQKIATKAVEKVEDVNQKWTPPSLRP